MSSECAECGFLLDPRFKNLEFLADDKREELVEMIGEEMERIPGRDGESAGSGVNPSAARDDGPRLSKLSKLMGQQCDDELNFDEMTVAQELELYQSALKESWNGSVGVGEK